MAATDDSGAGGGGSSTVIAPTRILGITEGLDFSPEQLSELNDIASEYGLALRHIHQRHSANIPISRDEWIQFVNGCDIVISGKQGLSARDESGTVGTEGIYGARDVVVSHPFVNVAWVDGGRLSGSGTTLLYAPGCNRDAVSEWVLGCAITLFRDMRIAINKRQGDDDDGPNGVVRSRSLKGKSVAILGRGAVGSRVGEMLGAMGMDVRYLPRRGDGVCGGGGGDARTSICDVVRDVDLVVNCLSSKSENANVLDREFFHARMPRGCTFVSMTNPSIYDIDGLLDALRSGRLRGAAIDVGNTYPGDVRQANYARFVNFLDVYPEYENSLIVTPQVAHFSDISQRSSFDMAIENVRYAASGRLDMIPDRVWR